MIKRVFDVTLVVALLPAVIPLCLAAVLAVLLISGRPVFFVQTRVGRDGRPFRLVKFRTMRPATDAAPSATSSHDPRITQLGKWMRRAHIDEIPQLWNILRGEMSLVGPRPEQLGLAAVYQAALPNYDLRHLLRPGLSGWAQVHFGYASDLAETRSKLEYDLFYLKHFGAWTDLQIFVRTLAVYMQPRYVR